MTNCAKQFFFLKMLPFPCVLTNTCNPNVKKAQAHVLEYPGLYMDALIQMSKSNEIGVCSFICIYNAPPHILNSSTMNLALFH